MRLLRHNERFVGVAREIRHKSDRRIVLGEEPPAVGALRGDDVLHQGAAVLLPVAPADRDLVLDRLEDEVGRVNLAVRVRVGDADDLALVLEGQHVVDLRPGAQLAVLPLPRLQQRDDLRQVQLGERQVVPRRVADDAGHAARRAVAVDAAGRRQVRRRGRADARHVVVEHEDAVVRRVAGAAHARVAGAEGAVGHVARHHPAAARPRLAGPGAVVAVGRHDHPLLAQRMPALFPSHVRHPSNCGRRWAASRIPLHHAVHPTQLAAARGAAGGLSP